MIKTYCIGPMGTNCYLYVDDKTGEGMLVDPAYADKKLFDDLKSENVKYIVVTHAHADHIMGVSQIKEITGAKVVCHENETARLLGDDTNLYPYIGYTEPYIPVSADVVVKDGDKLQIGDSEFSIMHTPGHTNGSICLVGDGVIFSGDTIFNGTHGRIDFPTGSGSQMIESFKRIIALDGDYDIYAGHDSTTTLSKERQSNPLCSYL